MMRDRWRLMVTVLVLALALGVASCGDDEEEPAAGGGAATEEPASGTAAEEFPADTTMGKIQAKGEIAIGVKYDVPPFGFKNPNSGAVEGFDVDLGKAVAEKLGVKPKLVEAISDNRIPFIQDGTVDLVLSTMTINAERALEIGFTDPYFIAKGRILVPKDSDIKGIDDLAGRKVCTALGSTYEETLKTEAPKADLKLVDALLGVPGAAAERRSRRDLDRRRDPHRHDHPGRLAEARRRRADGRAVRRRLQEGRHGVRRVPQRRAGGVQERGRLAGVLRQVARAVHRRAAVAAGPDARRGTRRAERA